MHNLLFNWSLERRETALRNLFEVGVHAAGYRSVVDHGAKKRTKTRRSCARTNRRRSWPTLLLAGEVAGEEIWRGVWRLKAEEEDDDEGYVSSFFLFFFIIVISINDIINKISFISSTKLLVQKNTNIRIQFRKYLGLSNSSKQSK